MSLSARKPRVHYNSIAYCELGEHAHVFVIDHPKHDAEWVYTTRVEHIVMSNSCPIFETNNYVYCPALRDNLLDVAALEQILKHERITSGVDRRHWFDKPEAWAMEDIL